MSFVWSIIGELGSSLVLLKFYSIFVLLLMTLYFFEIYLFRGLMFLFGDGFDSDWLFSPWVLMVFDKLLLRSEILSDAWVFFCFASSDFLRGGVDSFGCIVSTVYSVFDCLRCFLESFDWIGSWSLLIYISSLHCGII